MGATALAAGISGLKASQTALNVIGDNLANLNTAGFKSSRITFADAFSQTLEPAQAASSSLGSVNSIQIGSGTSVASIDMDFSQGTITSTGNPFDLAIQGDGFFVVSDGEEDFYTRVGAFSLDENNDLVDSATGLKVQGTFGDINIDTEEKMEATATSSVTIQGNLDSDNAIGATSEVLTSASVYTASGGATATAGTALSGLSGATAFSVAAGDTIEITGTEADGSSVSTTFTFGAANDGTTLGDLRDFISASFGTGTATIDGSGNIVMTADMAGDTSLALSIDNGTGNTGSISWASFASVDGTGDTYTTTVSIFDEKGASIPVTLTFSKTGDDVWDLIATTDASIGSVTTNITALNFTSSGGYDSATTGDGNAASVTILTSAGTQTITLDFGSGFDGVSQVSGSSTVASTDQNGNAAGFYVSTSIGEDGSFTTLFTNGLTKVQSYSIIVVTFANEAGLSKAGDNLYTASASSGEAVASGGGNIVAGALEDSNVDIAVEFTNMIIHQRAFQANARTITVADEVLQELVNIVR